MPLITLMSSAMYVFSGDHLIPLTWPICSHLFDIAVWVAFAISLGTCVERCGIKIE